MDSPTVAIAIPAFERTTFLRQAIDSALAQTHPASEILVVDNGSSHGDIAAICAEYPDVAFHRNPTNLGMFRNWNRCVELANADYVMILGDDDVLLPEYVATIVASAAELDGPDLVYTGYETFSDDPDARLWQGPHLTGVMSGQALRTLSARHGLFFPVISCAFKKSSFQPFYTAIHASNDWLWSITLPDTLRCAGLDRRLVRYRKHGAGDSEVSTARNAFSHMCIYWILHKRLLRRRPVDAMRAWLRMARIYVSLRRTGALTPAVHYFGQADNVYHRAYSELSRSGLLELAGMAVGKLPPRRRHA